MELLSNERWPEIDALFDRALDLDVAERTLLLEGVDDLHLRHAVERLLVAEAPAFLSGEAVDYAALLLQGVPDDDELTTPGRQIGPYRIVREIGRGGMGTVYKARHDRLGRHAALKFLPPHLAADDTTKQRFLAEARAAAALDHPNICTIHDIGAAEDGRLYIAMACYEGETLRARIVRGPLLIEEVLDLAVRVAEGLAAAHAAGIVHRDVKPANVMVTDTGSVKLLDFGLARLEGSLHLTRAGARMGTVAYMSPEQARGDDVDHQTDVWALGVMLYEMLAGRRPFDGDHEQAVIYGILHGPPPPLLTLRPDAPPALADAVEKALAKEPAARYADMEALLKDLRAVQQDVGLPAPRRVSAGSKTEWGTIAVAMTGAALLVLAFVTMRSGEPEPQAPPASHQRITATGAAFTPEISPDGRFVAYLTYESETKQRVVVQELSGGNPITVLDPCYECWNLRWLPDGSALSFSALLDPESPPGNFLVPRTGGALRRLDPFVTFFSWSPDGTRYAGASTRDKRIVIVDVATGEIVDRLDLDVPFMWFRGLDWSPSGDRLLFVTHDEQLHYVVWTVTVEGHRVQKVAEAPSGIFTPRWSADGEAIYYLLSQGGTEDLMKVSVDLRSGAAAGPATAILTGLETDDTFSLSGDGEHMAYARAALSSHLWLLALANPGTEPAQRVRPLTTGTGWNECPSISPDGQTIAFHQVATHHTANIFVMPLGGGSPRQVTHGESENLCPVWSPDGATLAFSSNEGGSYRLWTVDADGGTPQPLTRTRISRKERLAWAPGAHLLYRRLDSGDLYVLDPASAEGRPLQADTSRTLQSASSPRYSPDGERVAVSGWGVGSPHGLWALRLDDGAVTLLQEGRSTPVGWSEGGDWIYVLERGIEEAHLVMVHTATGETRMLTVLPEDIHRGLSSAVPQVTMTPDGRQFVFPVRQARVSDAMLVEGFDPAMR